MELEYCKKPKWGKVSDLKALDTFGNYQRPVFSLGVSQHIICIKKQLCENFDSILTQRKNILVAPLCVLSDA